MISTHCVMYRYRKYATITNLNSIAIIVAEAPMMIWWCHSWCWFTLFHTTHKYITRILVIRGAVAFVAFGMPSFFTFTYIMVTIGNRAPLLLCSLQQSHSEQCWLDWFFFSFLLRLFFLHTAVKLCVVQTKKKRERGPGFKGISRLRMS